MDCYGNVSANTGTNEGNENNSNSTTLSSGTYIASKPFNEWAKWSHSWEGTKTYGITGGKYKEGLYPGITETEADEYAMKNFWKPNNIDSIKDSSVAISCMFCVYWTGNMHLVYQAVENPNVYGGRPNPLPRNHARLDNDIINKINQIEPLKIFTNIKKQLGWFGQKNQPQVYRKGHRRRWYSINFHEQLILNQNFNKTIPGETEFLEMIEKL